MEQSLEECEVQYAIIGNDLISEGIPVDLGQLFIHDGNYYIPSTKQTFILQNETNADDIQISQEEETTIIKDENTLVYGINVVNGEEINECHYTVIEDPIVIKDGETELISIDNNVEVVDITNVVGKNLLTGQIVTLPEDCFIKKKIGRVKKPFEEILNKKIELGVTSKGKRLFGRILDIYKPSETLEEEKEDVMHTELFELSPPTHYVEAAIKTLISLMDMLSVNEFVTGKPLMVKIFDRNESGEITNLGKLRGCMHKFEDSWTFLNFNDEINDEKLKEIVEIKYKLRYASVAKLSMIMAAENDILKATCVKMHPSIKQYSCILCYKELKSIKNLHRHYANNHNNFDEGTSDTSKLYLCIYCNRFLRSAFSLKRHMSVHNPLLRILQCSICKQRFSDNTSLQRHLMCHAGIKPHNCDICDKSFTSGSDLNVHRRTHLDGNTHVFTCYTCGRKFSRLGNMLRHAKIHKNGLHECHICGCSYQHPSSLTRHVLQAHVSHANNNNCNDEP